MAGKNSKVEYLKPPYTYIQRIIKMAINQIELRSKALKYASRTDNAEFSAPYQKKKTAFLCHSHLDEQMVKGLVVLFQEAEIDLYIDWQDAAMPEKPNNITAKKIQRKIIEQDIFLFLATENAKQSRWCPWEIGYADAKTKKIYVIPTSDGKNTYGNEYLELYASIDTNIYYPGNYLVNKPNERFGQPLLNSTLF